MASLGLKRPYVRMRNTVEVPHLDLSVIAIPKSASSSALGAVFQAEYDYTTIHCDDLTTSRAVSMWRHPTSRVWSAYKYHKPRMMVATERDVTDNWYPCFTKPFDEFLYELAAGCRENRMLGALLPQHEYVSAPVEHIMIPWDFHRLAAILEVDSIPLINEGVNPEPCPDITPTMQRHLNIVYGADYRIWDFLNEKKG